MSSMPADIRTRSSGRPRAARTCAVTGGHRVCLVHVLASWSGSGPTKQQVCVKVTAICNCDVRPDVAV